MRSPPELVFVPMTEMGHILSIIRFAKLLLERNKRISVSIHIMSTPTKSTKIDTLIDNQSRDNPYPTRLTFVTYPSLANLLELSNPFRNNSVVEHHKPLLKKAIEEHVRTGLGKPVAFVLDMFSSGMVDIANELNVPSYVFFTSGAGVLSLIFYVQSLADDRGIDIWRKFTDLDLSMLVPGFKNLVTSKVIPGALQDKEGGSEMVLNFSRTFRKMKGILVNTYVELELGPIQALANSDDRSIPTIYHVGPILELDDKSRGGLDGEECESLIEWLDDQPKCSVVFLCFGSMGAFDEEQVKEVAKGLERSGYRFLWVLQKPPPTGKVKMSIDREPFLEGLPEGFIDRTINRGKLIGWAPQVTVLAHQAIGGFVSHCGWNSTLESLWFGVPMATWPMFAEQQLNAFQLVKELELAVEMRIDYRRDMLAGKGNFIIMADEIEKTIKKLLNIDAEMSQRINKMGNEGKNALKEEGSSSNCMRRFIDDVLSLDEFTSEAGKLNLG